MTQRKSEDEKCPINRNTVRDAGIGLIPTNHPQHPQAKGGLKTDMYYAAKKEMLVALYRHTMLTAQQLSLYLHYSIKTIYSMAVDLKAQGLIRSTFLPFLRHNHVGYNLTAYGARAAAGLAGDEKVYRAKAWEEDPVQMEHFFGTNAFFISLIRHSLIYDKEGLVEWLDPREAAERYAQFKENGHKAMPVKPDGFGTYLLPDCGRLVFHLEYDTGTESMWRLKDKMWNYGRLLPTIWKKVENVHVLFLTQIEGRARQLLPIWESLCKGDSFIGTPIPQVWAISEMEWKQGGVPHAKWWGVNGERVTLKEMQLLPLPPEAHLPILGKQFREPSPMQRS